MNDGRTALLLGATSDIGRATTAADRLAVRQGVNEAEPSPTHPLGGGLSCRLAP